MDQQILDMLSRLAELTPDELAELDGLLVAEFERLDGLGVSAEIVKQMDEVAASITRVRETTATKAEEQAAAEARAAELRDQIHAVDDGTAEDADPTVEGDPAPADEVVDPEAPAVDPAVVEDPAAPVAVAAAAGRVPPRPSLESMSGRRRSASQRGPSASEPSTNGRGRAEVIAARPFSGHNNGQEISSWDSFVLGMTDAVNRLGKGSGEDVLVASVQTTYPEDRRLTGDVVGDSKKIDAVVDLKTSLVASGGICNPVNVDYTIPVFADDDEPVKAALPTFQADRGGLRFVTPPTFAGVGASGTALWTEVTDAGSPGNSLTKPVQTFVCGTEVEVYVDAIATRLRFGNMMSRFSPEIVEANTKLALANAARLREEHRLTQIASYSTIVSSSQLLGAARDMMATLDLACEAYRYRQRLNRTTQLRAILPSFLYGMLRADLTRAIAHDGDGLNDPVTDAQIDAWFAARNVSPIWTMDDTPAPGSGTITYTYQGFGAQSAQTALVDWPAKVSWFLFAEGTFQLLDGGTLNLGVVRDSTLDASNNYETFVEIFESIAKRGVESLQIVSSLRPNGASAGTVLTANSPVVY